MILRLFNKKEIEISDASTNLIIVMEGKDAAPILDAVKELTDANLVQYYLVTAQAEIPCERGHVISTSIEYTGEAWRTTSVLKQLPGADYKAVSEELAAQVSDISAQLSEANEKITERDAALAILFGEEVVNYERAD